MTRRERIRVGIVADKPFALELEGSDDWLRLGGDFPGGLTLEARAGNAAARPAAARHGPPANAAERDHRFAEDVRTGTRTPPDARGPYA